MVRKRKPPSQTWRTFLENHAGQLVAIDFLVMPTVSFRLLFIFVVLAHQRRHAIHGVSSSDRWRPVFALVSYGPFCVLSRMSKEGDDCRASSRDEVVT
jgi:hypothetical protein